MKRFFAATFALILLSSASLHAEEQASSADAQLQQILDEDWEWRMSNYPEWGTYIGEERFNDRWTDMSLDAIEERDEYQRDLLKQLEGIDASQLSDEQRLNYDLFLYNTKQDVLEQEFPSDYLQISQMGGVHSRASDIVRVQPMNDADDYEQLFARLRAVPQLIDQNIALLQKGAESGVTHPRVVLEKAGELIQRQIVDDPALSPIYTQAFENLPDSLSDAEKDSLRNEAIAVIRDEILPFYTKFLEFFETQYLPKARTSVGLSEVPNGKAWYESRIRNYTTTDMTADEIHQLGLEEVARIRKQMEAIKDEVGFEGTLQEFFEFLRTDPQFYFQSKEELLKEYRDISKRADAELPKLFGFLPRLPYGVIPVPEYQEKFQTTAYYVSGSQEAGRAGYFYANTYDLPSRPKWEMEALTLHEAVPGHHLQISIAQELEGLPNFRKHGGYTAYVEGWGLYAESLGDEMGMYEDPYSRFGMLIYEMWRAIRLVVDTGLHAKGWTRQQAIDFFMENASKTRHDVEVEVDRYIVWPGQALAYKIGQLKILELRRLAEKELGKEFDIREFHDQVLGAGALPLAILESRMKDWIASQKKISG